MAGRGGNTKAPGGFEGRGTFGRRWRASAVQDAGATFERLGLLLGGDGFRWEGGEDFDVADHHLVEDLLAPVDGLGGVGVGGVAGGVVEDGGDFQGAAAGDEAGLLEVVAGDVEEGLGLAVGGGEIKTASGSRPLRSR